MDVTGRGITFTGPLTRRWGASTVASALRRGAVHGLLPVPAPVAGALPWADLHSGTVQVLAEAFADDEGTPWPQADARTTAQFFTDGGRDAYEQVVFARARRLTRAAVLACRAVALGDDPAPALDEVATGVLLLCEQSSWCWPAHDDPPRRHAEVFTRPDEPWLDLGAAEVAAQLAWVEHLLAGPLQARYPGLLRRVHLEVGRRVLDPFTRRRDWHWIGLDGDVHNWNPWIHGHVLTAALVQLQGEDRARAVALVVEGLDRFVAALPDDGAVDEGWAYWWNGAGRALEALEVLRHASGGLLDARAEPRLHATVSFVPHLHLGGPWYAGHADAPARVQQAQPWRVLHGAAHAYGVPQAAAHAVAQARARTPSVLGHDDDGLGRLAAALTDRAWAEAVTGRAVRQAGPGASGAGATSAAPRAAGPVGPVSSWWGSVQVLVARERASSARGLTLTAKGGHNGEHHNHDDVGSFTVAVDGVPLLVDAGRPTYTAQTFGPRRHELWPVRGAWHNVPLVGGAEQGTGARYASRDVGHEETGRTSALHLDLAGAYPPGPVGTWRRSIALHRGDGPGQGHVRVTDRWTAAARSGEAGTDDATARHAGHVWHVLLHGRVEMLPDGVLVRPRRGGAGAVITWAGPVAQVRTTWQHLDDPWLTRSWGDHLTRLALDLPGTARGRLEVTVRAAP